MVSEQKLFEDTIRRLSKTDEADFEHPYSDDEVDALWNLWVAARAVEPGYISIQEAWVAAGGNPGIIATKEMLLTALRDLDAVCDGVDKIVLNSADYDAFEASLAEVTPNAALNDLIKRPKRWG